MGRKKKQYIKLLVQNCGLPVEGLWQSNTIFKDWLTYGQSSWSWCCDRPDAQCSIHNNSLAPVDVLFRQKLYAVYTKKKNAPAILFLYQSPNDYFMSSDYNVKQEIYAAFLLWNFIWNYFLANGIALRMLGMRSKEWRITLWGKMKTVVPRCSHVCTF